MGLVLTKDGPINRSILELENVTIATRGCPSHTSLFFPALFTTLYKGYNTVWSELCERIRANSLQTVL